MQLFILDQRTGKTSWLNTLHNKLIGFRVNSVKFNTGNFRKKKTTAVEPDKDVAKFKLPAINFGVNPINIVLIRFQNKHTIRN